MLPLTLLKETVMISGVGGSPCPGLTGLFNFIYRNQKHQQYNYTMLVKEDLIIQYFFN